VVRPGVAYLLPRVRRLARRYQQPRQALQCRTPARSDLFLAAVLVGIGAFAIRLFIPVGQNVWGLQLGYFSSYIALFGIGIAAWYGRWLEHLPVRQAVRWFVIALLAITTLPAALLLAIKLSAKPHFNGGWSWTAVLYAFWEPFVAWGLMAGWIAWTRERFNRPSPLWQGLGRRAFAMFIVHPPVLVAWSILLRNWSAPALAKFAVVGSLAWLGSLAVAELLVRIPGVRRVV